MTDFNDLVSGLRAWAVNGTAAERAAVEFLAWHGGWLRRDDFLRECVDYPEDVARINWRAARDFADRVTAGGLTAPRASSSEAAVLDLAVALGQDRFRLGIFGVRHRRKAAEAFASACGWRLEGDIPEPGHNHPEFIPGDPETCGACAREAQDEGRR